MSKKLIISLSVVLCCLTVVLILFWTLFALSSVSVNFLSTTDKLTVSEAEIVQAGEFRKGACVFFEGKKKSINKIYKMAETDTRFAYIRVVNIETKFPNKFVVHIAEREELFAIEFKNQYLVCDRDLRVLDIWEDFVSRETNPVLLQGLTINQAEVKIGDFLTVEQDGIKKFYSAMVQNNRDLNEQRGKFKSILISTYQDQLTKKEYFSLTMTSFQGKKYIINNIDFAFANKINKMFATETALYNQNTDDSGNIVNSKGEVIYVVKTENNEYVSYEGVKDLKDEEGNLIYDESEKVPMTYDLISKCAIKVDNLTITEQRKITENDIYYSLIAME